MRALYTTPLRTDPRTGALRPGLCRSWSASAEWRTWRFRCRRAGDIADELRRVRSLADSPSRWLLADTERIEARADTLVVRLRRPRRRFAYVLTAPAAAPPGVPGPFRVVSASARRIVVERPGLKLVFRRLEPHAAARAFRRGLVDEAPVPLGELRAALADPSLRGEVRVRPLLGVDLVGFDLRRGPLARFPRLRRAYWETADRTDYEALVTEGAAPAAFALVGKGRAPGAHEIAKGRRLIPKLPQVHVPIAVADDPELVYGAELLVSQWRELALGPTVDPVSDFDRKLARGELGAWFRRVIAPYPQPEALVGAALGGRRAALVPVARVAGARFVSPRLRGWRQDALGDVDYTRVEARA